MKASRLGTGFLDRARRLERPFSVYTGSGPLVPLHLMWGGKKPRRPTSGGETLHHHHHHHLTFITHTTLALALVANCRLQACTRRANNAHRAAHSAAPLGMRRGHVHMKDPFCDIVWRHRRATR
eukprot:scaffold276506_cov32-Tisochrysis_lutea.AAC.1